MQSLEKKSVLPSPFHYSIKPESVLPTKYKKIGFGYGLKSNAGAGKLSPGPGDYNLHSFTDKFKPSSYKQARKMLQRKTYSSIQPSPRDCSLAKPLTGGVFNPMGVITKDPTLGFNYPPMRMSNISKAANTMFYKTDGFQAQKRSQMNGSPDNLRKSAVVSANRSPALPEMGSASENSSMS